MKRVAVISAILENPMKTQNKFNSIIAQYKDIVRGRMGIPFIEEGISIISITVFSEVDRINSLTGKLGKLEDTQVKTSISKGEFE